MLTHDLLSKAIKTATPGLDEVRSKDLAKGLEKEIQLGILKELKKKFGDEAMKEKWLHDYRGETVLFDTVKSRIDIVYPGKTASRVVEIKVVRLPRLKVGQLYDWGQMTADYAHTRMAKGLEGGELVALLYGPIVEALEEPDLARAFHNHMFIDYESSMRGGDLDPERAGEGAEAYQKMRKIQKKAGKQLGWDRPYRRGDKATVAKVGRYAIVSIPIPGS